MSCEQPQHGHGGLSALQPAAQEVPGTWAHMDMDTDGAKQMTKKAVQQICREHGEFISPECCTTLYLHGHHFKSLQGLESFKAVRVLHLENNCLSSCAGLAHMTDLRALYLQQNNITHLGGLTGCTALATLNISGNPIMHITPGTLPASLLTLHAASTGLHDAASVEALSQDCPQLQVLDLQHNNGLQDASRLLPGLCHMTALRVLYMQGCPVSDVPNYRRILINGLPSLHYLDTGPVDEVERVGATAWLQGGKQAEQAARLAWRQEQRAAQRRTTLSFAVERAKRRLRNALGAQLSASEPLLQEDTVSAVQHLLQPPVQQIAVAALEGHHVQVLHPVSMSDLDAAIALQLPQPPSSQSTLEPPPPPCPQPNPPVLQLQNSCGVEVSSNAAPRLQAAAAASNETAAAAAYRAAAASDAEWWQDSMALVSTTQLQRQSSSQVQTLRAALQALTTAAAAVEATTQHAATHAAEGRASASTAAGDNAIAAAGSGAAAAAAVGDNAVTAAGSSAAAAAAASDITMAAAGSGAAPHSTLHASMPVRAINTPSSSMGPPCQVPAVALPSTTTNTSPRLQQSPRQSRNVTTGGLGAVSMQWVQALRSALNEHAFAPRPRQKPEQYGVQHASRMQQDSGGQQSRRHGKPASSCQQQVCVLDSAVCDQDSRSPEGSRHAAAGQSGDAPDVYNSTVAGMQVSRTTLAHHQATDIGTADSHKLTCHEGDIDRGGAVDAELASAAEANLDDAMTADTGCNLECAVCCSELTAGQLCVQLTSCQHMFHAACIKKWILTGLMVPSDNMACKGSRLTCPLCRASIAFPEQVTQTALVGVPTPIDLYDFSVQSLPSL